MQKIVELIGLEERHAKALAALKDELAQKTQTVESEHSEAMKKLEVRLQDKDEAIDAIVHSQQAEITAQLKKEASTEAKAVSVEDIEKVILEHIN
jgi:hypothetical protein